MTSEIGAKHVGGIITMLALHGRIFSSEENRTTRGKKVQNTNHLARNNRSLKRTINSSVSPVSKWKIFIPILKDYLKQSCASSKAGRISNHFSAWTSITSDKEILSDTRGMTIELSEMPAQHRFVQTKFNSAETEIIETEINKMLGK